MVKRKMKKNKETETYLLLLTDAQQEYPATPPLATTSFKETVGTGSFANKIIKATLNHHNVYINRKVTECVIWPKF